MGALTWLKGLVALGEQQRITEFGSSVIPSWSSLSVSSTGALVSYEMALSLSAVASAIRQPAVLTAGLPLDVYDVEGDRRERTLSLRKWQNLLLDQPDPMCSGFDFWSDLSSLVDGYGNACALKIRVRGRVEELVLLPTDRLKLEVDNKTRKRTFYYQRDGGERVVIPGTDILHVRGWDPSGRPWARSPIERHRDTIGKTNSRSRMEEKFLSNDARPGIVIQMPQNVTREQAAEFLELWDARHRGDPGKAVVLGGGGTIATLPVSFRDAQFVESEEFAVTDVARIFDWPADLLGRESERPFVELSSWVVKFHLMPRLNRIQDALAVDQDLFGVTSKFRPYFDVTELLRGDFATTSSVFKDLKQAGIMTANEGRIQLGFPPHPDGDELQVTPVGGAPNSAPPEPPTGGAEAPSPPEPEPPQ